MAGAGAKCQNKGALWRWLLGQPGQAGLVTVVRAARSSVQGFKLTWQNLTYSGAPSSAYLADPGPLSSYPLQKYFFPVDRGTSYVQDKALPTPCFPVCLQSLQSPVLELRWQRAYANTTIFKSPSGLKLKKSQIFTYSADNTGSWLTKGLRPKNCFRNPEATYGAPPGSSCSYTEMQASISRCQ